MPAIEVRECAVADRNGTAEISVPADRSWAHLTDHGRHPDTEAVLPVDVISLDDEIEAGRLPVPDVIKIDVEGYEIEVLKGLRNTLVNHDVTVICELHASNTAVLEIAAEVGYAVTNLEGPGNVADAGPTHILLTKSRT